MLAAAVAVFCFAVLRGTQHDRARTQAGELPSDLFAHAYRLERLTLPAGVESLDWLPDSLPWLSVGELSDRQARQLPSRLEHLEVRRGPAVGEELTWLSELPRSLRSLTVRFGSLESLGRVPPQLESLVLDRVGEFDPQQLPPTVEHLDLRSVRIASLRRGLARLESLRLSGSAVKGIDGIQRLRNLSVLSLFSTNVDSLAGIPSALQGLELEGNRLAAGWLPSDLPEFLVELRLRDQPMRLRAADGSIVKLPASLRLLHVLDRRAPRHLLAVLPDGLAELRLDGSGTLDLCGGGERPHGGLPVALEVLYLGGGMSADLSCLPDGLVSLYLEGVDPAALTQITPSLAGLGVVNSFDFDLADLEVSAENLRDLDLSFSRPRVQPDLAAWPQLVRLRYVDAPWVDLPRLPESLESLDLQGARRLQSIDGLDHWCPRLRSLNVGGSRLRSLAAVPRSVEELDLRGLSFEELDGLPTALRVLTVSAGTLDRFGALPAGVREIHVVDR